MKHYFKWDFESLEYMWRSELDLPCVFFTTNLSEEEVEKIEKWYNVKIEKWNLVIEDLHWVEELEIEMELKRKVEETKNLLIEKQALELLWEDTKEVEAKIQGVVLSFEAKKLEIAKEETTTE